MKRTWMLLAGLSLALVMAACSALKCRLKDQAVRSLASAYSEVFECAPEGRPAIEKMFSDGADAIGLCKKPQTGPIADALCRPVIEQTIGQLPSKLIPASHKCKATNVTAKAVEFLVEKCKLLPVEQ